MAEAPYGRERAGPIERRRIGIEEALRWAYRDELPKAQAVLGFGVGPLQFGQAWGGVERYGEFLTIIDAPENSWGLVPDLTALSSPHPDAVRIGMAVQALDTLELGLPDDWDPLGDMADMPDAVDLIGGAIGRAITALTVVDEAGVRRLRATPRHLVVKVALTGMTPDWHGERPEVRVEMANGKPKWFVRETLVGVDGPYEVEVDGLDRRLRVPKPGAYQRRYLDPDPLDVAVQRAEWEVWRAALDVLTEDLAGVQLDAKGRPVLDEAGREVPKLRTIAVEPSNRPRRPWDGEGDPGRRVLCDLTHPAPGGTMLLRGRFVPVDNSERGA